MNASISIAFATNFNPRYSQQRAGAAVIYLRGKPRMSYTHISEITGLNVKTIWERIQRAVKHGTFKDFDNRRLPRRVRDHIARTFKASKGYYMRIWNFIYGVYDTIEEALNGEHDDEDEPP